MSRVIFNKQTGRMEVMPDPRINKPTDRRPAVMPLVTTPKISPKLPPNILAGIGNIPGLNLDFSKLPGVKPGSLGGVMEFSEARKRAIMTGTKMPNIEDYDIPGLGPRSSDISTDVSADSTPQLGGDLDVNGNDIVSVSNGNINLLPNGSGKVIMDGNGSSGGVSITDGKIDIRTGTGAVSKVKFLCYISQ